MDNLPKDPPDQNNNPPPFGSNFNPHINNPVPNGIGTNPVDPNHPYQSLPSQTPSIPSQTPVPEPLNTPASPAQRGEPNLPNNPNYVQPSVHQEVAQHRLRDAHGQFLPYEHPNPTVSNSDASVSLPYPSVSSNPSDTPKPESNFKRFIKFIVKIKWAKVSLYIVSFIGVLNILINLPPVKNSISQLFPNSSPVFAREISIQGVLKSSDAGLYILVLPDQQAYTLHFKPSVSLANLKKLNEVVVKGNLTWTPYVIENAEVYPLNISTSNP